MNVYRGLFEGGSAGRGGEKERILRCEEDGSMPCICNNEIHQTLKEGAMRERRNGNIMEEMNLFKYTICKYGIITVKSLHINV
jgi:hypothetical protein